jgi:hypothetical protein
MKQLSYDVVIIGGGTTGVCAALAAARGGAKVAIIDIQGFLGGNACNGMAWYGFHSTKFVQMVSGIPFEIIQNLREINGASEFCPDPVSGSMVQVNSTLLKLVLAKMCIKENIDVHLHSLLTDVEYCNKNEQVVLVHSKVECKRYISKVLIDCTDTGDVAILAGALYHQGRMEDGKMQVASSTLFISGIDMPILLDYFKKHPDQLRPIAVPEEELIKLVERMPTVPVFGMGAFPDLIAKAKLEGLDYPRDRLVGQCFVQTGEMMLVASRVENVNPNNEESYSRAEFEGTLQMEVTLKLLRDYLPGCSNARISGSGHSIGIRETNHIEGDYWLETEDLMIGKKFSDCIACGSYHLDLHSPDHQGITTQHPPVYNIPYRCLLPKGIDGLLIAGRAFSATQLVQASTRVIPIAGAIGQAAGTAAAIAVKKSISPREIKIFELLNDLKNEGAII